jgi:phenylacetate-CoA ligase
MNDVYLQIYHRLPWPAKTIAASLRGSYLRLWRYGPESEKLTEAALEREQWSKTEWTSYSDHRLCYVLHRAATRVPYYRDYWTRRRLRGENGSWEYLENWPILEKKTVRENPAAFLADDCDSRAMFREYTSGTTGTPLRILSSRKTMRHWYALVEARWRHWYGVSRKDRWAIVGGQLVTPVEQCRPPFWVWNAGLNQLYMSSYHLAPRFIPHYLDALQNYSVKYLWGYSSSLHALALEALHLKKPVKLEVAIANAEPLFRHQREVISEAFGCPVRETYGMCEMVAAASECESSQLHLWPEVGLVETLHSENSCIDHGVGELVCTSLLNSDMPLVRYRVGDMGLVCGSGTACSCGRSLPLMSSIEGRTDDLLYTADGRVLGRLDPVFKSNLPIRAAQIIQEELDYVRVRYVPAQEFTHDTAKSIIAGLRARMGEVEVVLEQVEDIPRHANGKFRAVICNLSPEQRQAVSARSSHGVSASYDSIV